MLVISVFGKFEKGYFILIMVEIVVGLSFFWGYQMYVEIDKYRIM